jgi:conjugative relaxase-like TrwC/TraI family protein
VGTRTRWGEDGEALYDEHDAAAALGVEADELERMLAAGQEVATGGGRRSRGRPPAGSYLVAQIDGDGARWVPEGELVRVEAARAEGPSPEEIAAGGGIDDLLPLAEAARLAGVSARYLRGLAGRWERHRAEIEQARQEGRSVRRAYVIAWRGTKNRWLIKRSDLAEFVSRRTAPAVRVGFDLTLTTEKSLGVLALLGSDEVRGAVLGAIESGNDLALRWWERHARVRVGGELVPADGWTAASFRHLTSRALDPFPHHHNVVANATRSVDGERRTLDSRSLYRHAVGASALATAEMRHRLMAALGVRWRRSPSGGWEIDGLPPDVLREFSRRRNEIEEALAELEEAIGRTSTIDELRNIVAETRPAKQQADPTDLRANWWKRATSHGFSPRDLEQCTGRASPHEPRRDQIVSLLDRLGAPDGITAEGSIFTRGDLLSALADAPLRDDNGDEQPLLVGAVRLEELADAFLASQRVMRLEPGDNRPRLRGLGDEPLYTTTKTLRIQQRIIDAYRNGLHAGSAVATGGAVDAALRSAGQLSHEQAELVRWLCTSGHHLQCAVGRAGTGKTTAMRVAASALAASGYRVVGAAIKGEAARALGAAAGIPTETVAWYLAHPDPHRGPLDSRTVLIVDEASTLGDADLDRLIELAQRAGATVRLIGDPAQHGAVAAGGMFRVLCEQHPAHTPQLTENRRLQHTGDLAAVEALRGGHIEQALAELEAAGHLHLAADDLQLYARLLARWWDARQNGAPHPLVERSNHRRRQLNRLARRVLQAHGEIASDEIPASGGRAFAAGDEVIARRGSRQLYPAGDRASYLRNGSRGVIAGIERGHRPDDDALVIDFPDLGTIRVHRAFFDDHPGRDGRIDAGIDHRYAVTSYAVQGATFEESTGRVDERTSRAEVYVDLTRGRNANHLYATRAEDPLDGERLPKAPPPPLDAALAIRLRASGAEVTAWELDPDALARVEASVPARSLA